jgi:hypothetical protein
MQEKEGETMQRREKKRRKSAGKKKVIAEAQRMAMTKEMMLGEEKRR